MFDVSDVDQFASRLSAPVELVEEPWRDDWSEKVADEMWGGAPVDTGALRDSIRTNSEGVEVGVPYGAYVEYGTSRTAPQPFTVPAINRIIRRSAEDAGVRVIRILT